MNVTVKVVCYKSKTLANGEHPLMIRVCKDGKKKYQSLGISVNPKYWDSCKNELKPQCPNYEYICRLIAEKEHELIEGAVKLKCSDKRFTASTLIEQKSIRVKPKTVGELFLEQIERLETERRRGYMLSVRQVYNSLISFNKHLDIYFSDIDLTFLRRYESFLRKQGLATSTMGIRFRTLRAIYNLAMEEGLVEQSEYPFKKFKLSKLQEETVKRAISKQDVDRILAFKSTNRFLRFPIDLFAFTYYCGGINFVDIANLTSANIIEGKLIYKRQKTGKLIRIPLLPQALALIQKYDTEDSPYLFPILSDFHKTDIQKANRIHKVITQVNKRLQEIGTALGIDLKITTYVARHSQATVMKRAGVSTSVIKEIMGHSSERVTQIYLDSFDNEKINDALGTLSCNVYDEKRKKQKTR